MGVLEYLFSRPGPAGAAFGLWGGFLLGLYVGLALMLLFLYPLLRTFSVKHSLHRIIARRVVMWGTLLQVVGVCLVGLRVLNLSIVSLRIWTVLWLLVEVGAAIALWLWRRREYPAVLAQFELAERKRAFVPRGSAPPSPPTLPTRRRQTARRR